MSADALREEVERLQAMTSPPREEALPVVEALLDALERGEVRAAEPRPGKGWTVHSWVKRGILLGFRVGVNTDVHVPPVFHFRDRDPFPTRDVSGFPDVRIVPGGTTVRRGACLSPGVVVMPPTFINVGAFVGEKTMVDSHALVGSCAQIGARVHLSAGTQVGGVLEPVGALPVIVEDDVLVGGGCGIFEGTLVRAGAVLGAGVVLTRSVTVVDLVRQSVHRAVRGMPLMIPERAVVVPGARPASGDFARAHGVLLQAPVIVKYREESQDAALALEEALR